MTVKRLTKDAIMLALLIISAFTNITLPVSEAAFTLQVLVVFLLAFVLPLADAGIVLFTYILMGLIGIPVFSTGGGFSYLVRPTFGYILGFLSVPFVVKPLMKLPIKNEIIKRIIASIIALIVLYILGTVYFYYLKNFYGATESTTKITFIRAVKLCVIPFIPFDLLKIIGAILISLQLDKIAANSGEIKK